MTWLQLPEESFKTLSISDKFYFFIFLNFSNYLSWKRFVRTVCLVFELAGLGMNILLLSTYYTQIVYINFACLEVLPFPKSRKAERPEARPITSTIATWFYYRWWHLQIFDSFVFSSFLFSCEMRLFLLCQLRSRNPYPFLIFKSRTG